MELVSNAIPPQKPIVWAPIGPVNGVKPRYPSRVYRNKICRTAQRLAEDCVTCSLFNSGLSGTDSRDSDSWLSPVQRLASPYLLKLTSSSRRHEGRLKVIQPRSKLRSSRLQRLLPSKSKRLTVWTRNIANHKSDITAPAICEALLKSLFDLALWHM